MKRLLRFLPAFAAWVTLALSPVSAAAQLMLLGAGGRATASSPAATFVAASYSDTNTCTLTCAFSIPAAAASGDLLLVYYNDLTNAPNATVTTPTGSIPAPAAAAAVSAAEGPWEVRVYCGQLAAGDLGGSFSVSNAAANAVVIAIVYRGPTTCSTKPSVTGAIAASSVAITGFTAAANTAGVVAFPSVSRQQATPTSQSGWTARLANVAQPNNSGFFHFSALDLLSGYAGAGVTWSPYGTGGCCSEAPFVTWVELLN